MSVDIADPAPGHGMMVDEMQNFGVHRDTGMGQVRQRLQYDVALAPRLAEQPIFYPVLNEAYAIQIARDWNAPRGGGWVTRFEVKRSFLDAYEVQQAGARTHLEYWIPADDLDAFNDAIVGEIKVTAEFH